MKSSLNEFNHRFAVAEEGIIKLEKIEIEIEINLMNREEKIEEKWIEPQRSGDNLTTQHKYYWGPRRRDERNSGQKKFKKQ